MRDAGLKNAGRRIDCLCLRMMSTVGLCAAIGVSAASASSETLQGAYTTLGKKKDWEAIQWSAGSADLCAIRTEVDLAENSERGEAVAFLTYEPGQDIPVFSYITGRHIPSGQTGAEIVVDDDELRIELVGYEDAFFVHPSDDKVLYEALKMGGSARVEANFSDGVRISDEFSLMGILDSTRILERAGC